MKSIVLLAMNTIVTSAAFGLTYSGGDGTAGNPYQIANKTDLLSLGGAIADYDKYFILTANIDLAGTTFVNAIIAPDTNSATVDFEGTPFDGSFDGGGHTIGHLTLHNTSQSFAGLFGYIGPNGQIKNLKLENVDIQGDLNVGGLAGFSQSLSITSCQATGSIKANTFAGGLIGYCHAPSGSNTISLCSAQGTVDGTWFVGGLIGRNSGDRITSCYAASTVTSTGDYTGGLIGYNYGNIVSCYAAGSVKGDLYVGGLVGYQEFSEVHSSYTASKVVGTFGFDALAGWSYASDLFRCFWDTDISGQTSSPQWSPEQAQGKTTAEMKTLTTFTGAGWDFTNETANGTSDFWRMCADGADYPRLSWEFPLGDFACPDGVNGEDLDTFALRWMMTKCTPDNNYCGGVDMDASGKIDLADWAVFAGQWMK